MSVEAKHAYRFGYLKSEEWQTVRSAALAKQEARCAICDKISTSNDAHHVFYRDNIWETKSMDLAILCRSCHKLVHEILKIEVPTPGDSKGKVHQFRQLVYALRGEVAPLRTRQSVKNRLKSQFKRAIQETKLSMDCFGCKSNSVEIHPRPVFVTGLPSRTWSWCDDCWQEVERRDIKNWKSLRTFLEEKRSGIAESEAWSPVI